MNDQAEFASMATPAQDVSDAAQRSRMYALLAEAFTFPEGDESARLLSGELQAALNETAALLDLPGDISVPIYLPQHAATIPQLQTLHTRLFEVGGGSTRVSSVERSYDGGPSQKLWEKLLRFYSFFGLDFSQGNAREQPDHLLTQLSFMHYLCFLEAGSQGSTVDLRRGQRDFLSSHLSRWAADFSASLQEQDEAEPYARLGKLLVIMTASDLEQLERSLVDE